MNALNHLAVDIRLVGRVWYQFIYSKPLMFLRFLGLFVAVIVLLQWLFNLETLQFILQGDNGLSAIDKVDVLVDAFVNVFARANGIVPISFIIIGFCQASAIVLMVLLRSSKRLKMKQTPKSLVLALVGSGCVACGGSVLTPLLAILASNISATLAERVGDIMLVISVALSYRALSQISFAFASAKVQTGA